jgi:anti-sigma B factor antagonist
MKIERYEPDPTALVLVADDDLNEEPMDPFIAHLEAGGADGARVLVVDCDRLEWLASRGIGNLLHLQKRLRPAGVTVRISGLRDDLAPVLQVTRVNTLIELFPTVADAVKPDASRG